MKNNKEIAKLRRKIMNMKVKNWTTNQNSPLHRNQQYYNPVAARKQRKKSKRHSKGQYTSAG